MAVIPVAPDYSTMSVAEVVGRRERVLNDINAEVSNLNRQFRENPMKLDTETIGRLFSDLKDINADLEEKKREAVAGRPRRCCPNVTKTTWITIGLEGVVAVLAGGAEVANFVVTKKLEDQISDLEDACNTTLPGGELAAITGLGIFRIVCVVTAAAILLPLISAIREIDNDRDKALLLMRISELKEQGEDIRNFLMTFQQFKSNVQPDSGAEQREQKDAFAQCVHSLDKLPEKGFREQIPSRDHWISLMVGLLPEDHPIKVQLKQMRDAALAAASPSRARRSTLASTSSTDDDDDSSSSGSDSPTPRRKFRGEKMPAHLAIEPLGGSGSSALRRRHQGYRTQWALLEDELGFRMNCVQLGDKAISRDGETAPHISHFGATLPDFLDDDAAASSSDSRVDRRSAEDMV